MYGQKYISCNLSIYDAGGFPGGQELFNSLRHDKNPEIRSIATLYGPARYDRVLDPAAVFADAAMRPRLEAVSAAFGCGSVVAPGCVVVRIDAACIRDRGITVLRDGEWLPLFETYRPADLYACPLPGPCRTTQALPDTHAYLLLTSSGTFNWGHWLAEDLPRLRAVNAIAADGRPLCLLMHGFVPAVDRRKLDLLRVLLNRADVTVRLLRPDTDYRVDGLYFASPVSGLPGPKHPQALADLAGAAEILIRRLEKRWWRPRRGRPKRVFVIRRRQRGRVPIDQERLAADLRAQGYQPLDPEGISAIEQVAIFAGAERVVGCMGAAMVNTLFCRPGSRILHLAAETFTDPYFLDLAAARGHAYGVCYGAATDPAKPSQSNYVLNPRHLASALAWLEEGAERSVA